MLTTIMTVSLRRVSACGQFSYRARRARNVLRAPVKFMVGICDEERDSSDFPFTRILV